MIPSRKDTYLLHLENVYKQYGDRVILQDIDFSVEAGELCTVVGPSGCGKSTLLRLILGQESASSGQLFIAGKQVGFPDPERGIVYQRYSLFPHLTVMQNVSLGKRLLKSENRPSKRQLNEETFLYLTKVRLDEHAHKYPHELSGGMQQRAAIAQALIMKPRILLMDEPFGALDPQTREDMQLFLLERWEQEKMTVFFVTHDLEEAVYLGTRLIALSQYYSDDNKDQSTRGAKIVADHKLASTVQSSRIKHLPDFVHLMNSIRQAAFDPKFLQHVSEFDLKHPDSFRT